jgi:predicted dinucleotide-utilizing enzyme
MKDIIIVGAGGLGREVLQWLTDINQKKETWKIKGFIDDNIHALKNYTYPKKVLGTIEDWKPSENEVFVCAISDPDIKERVVKTAEVPRSGIRFAYSPDAAIGAYNELGEGVVIYPDARITVM